MSKVDSILVPIFETDGPDYEVDFCAWSEEQSRRLRALRIPGLDIENLAEEIESLSRSDKHQLASRMKVLLMHLLKQQQHQPEKATGSWRSTIRKQRRRIDVLLSESPSLRPSVSGVIETEYPYAVADAVDETGLPERTFAASCPWTPDEVLSLDFLTADPVA